MTHLHRLVQIRREERRIQRDVANVSTRDAQPRELEYVEILHRRFRRDDTRPNFRALWSIRKRKRNHKPQTPQERRIERCALVRCEYREPAIRLHALQQVTDLDVRVTIVAVA